VPLGLGRAQPLPLKNLANVLNAGHCTAPCLFIR
jgi:hypothetical protein